MSAPTPQICFRHTPLPTPKFAETLKHVTSRPQVSFTVAPWRLCKPSSVSNFANIGLPRKAARLKFKHVLEAISCGETTADNRGQPGKRNGALRFKAARPSVLNFSFCCLVVAFTTHRKILYISISRSTTMEPTDTIWKVCGRTGETK